MKIIQGSLKKFFYLLCFLSESALAESSAYGVDATQMGIEWVIPFAGILLSLALMPIIVPRFWHSHAGKVALFWSLAVIIPLAITQGIGVSIHEILHTYLLEYIPFIILVSTLFTISGGIKVQLCWSGKPTVNTALLCVATLLANWISTTGAAMLFIRPLINMNAWRKKKTHLVIFFIVLVCNLGGSLTALGDPPLFLGFLNGVDFFWPMYNMFLPFILVSGPVLLLFYLADIYYYKSEDLTTPPPTEGTSIQGWINVFLLLGVMAAVIASGTWKSGVEFTVLHVPLKLENILRDLTLIALAVTSVVCTSRAIRSYNLFSWAPVLEVAKLFAAIFVAAMPVIAILRTGKDGVLAPLIGLVTHNGEPVNFMYFWITGGLSAFLDNAPTYLVFFHIAGGNAEILSGPLAQTLTAISAGSVFMGALTYIGNAPNFMVKSIAEINNIPMPSFFTYMFYTMAILLPLFIVISYLLF